MQRSTEYFVDKVERIMSGRRLVVGYQRPKVT
jgi:hypothetical protein